MSPMQVAHHLRGMGVAEAVVKTFQDHVVCGQTIVDGISDQDLIDMGVVIPIMQRGVRHVLNQLTRA